MENLEERGDKEKLVKLMKDWQKGEGYGIESATEIKKKSGNPLIKMVMEIIRRDSELHREVQQLILNHFEKESIELNPEELKDYWDLFEEHDALERRTVDLAQEALKKVKSPFVAYLLNYLYSEEKKHSGLMEEFSRMKDEMYPYV